MEIGEGILHAINEEFVEAVEMLLNYQDNGGHLVDVWIISLELFLYIFLIFFANIKTLKLKPVIIEQNKKDGKLVNKMFLFLYFL